MMKALVGELLVDRAREGGSIIHLFVAQPTPLEEKNLGKIFALIEFTAAYPFIDQVVRCIDDSFFQSYYRSADFETEAAFERSLHKVNSAIRDFIHDHGEEWLYKTNIAIGVLYDMTLHLSYLGRVEAYIAQTDGMLDIIQHPQTAEIQPLKPFNNIISGKCPEKSGVIIATSTLLDYLSLEKIRRTIFERSPAESVQFLESVLSEHDTLANVGAFIVKFERGSAVQLAEPSETLERAEFNDRQDSMEKLIHQERATGDLLTPSIWPTMKGRLKNLTGKINERPQQSQKIPQRAQSQNYGRMPSLLVRSFQWTGRFLLNFGRSLISLSLVVGKACGKWLRHFFRNPDSLSASLGGSVRGVSGWWRRLTFPRKIFLVLFAIAIIVFGISVLGKNSSVENEEQKKKSAQAITDVQNLLGEVESKQIMKDEAGARELLIKAEETLSTVPKDSDVYKENGDALNVQIDSLNATLNKVQTLEQLTVTADFATAAQDITIGKITKIGNNLFGFAEGSGFVVRANLSDQSVSTTISGSEGETYRFLENDSAATTLALTEKQTFVQFNPVLEKISSVTVNLKEKVGVTDFDIYADRLYVLDAKNKNILRLEKSGDSYGQAQVWMGTTDELVNAVSFDIDGSVYILFSDGTIKKYDGGKKSEFDLGVFSPSLAGATLLVKTEATTPFYLLNPTTQRVVIIGPDGTLRNQYVHPDFARAKDMVVDKENQVIYILGDNKVYSISLK